MAIDIKEVRRRLTAFALEYADASDEKQQAEHCVKSARKTTNFIDGYIPGKLTSPLTPAPAKTSRAAAEIRG